MTHWFSGLSSDCVAITIKELNTVYFRLTWNYLGIPEFLLAGNRSISVLLSKIQQVNLIRSQLIQCIDEVASSQLLM
jgi:hypothetical protein